MKIHILPISGAAVVDVEPKSDSRGVFCRWFCQKELESLVGKRQIVNVNFSRTEKIGSIRGMHFQYPPKAEMKLVRCIRGKVFDVIVDLRKKSPTFMQYHTEILSQENGKMIVIPEGLAHGFQALEEGVELIYFMTEFYSKEHSSGIRYSDPKVGIDWPLSVSEISIKDKEFPFLDDTFEGIPL